MAPAAWAGGRPENLAVVVNPNDPNSLAVANAYVELRQIPPGNVLYIPWKPDTRLTTAAEFRNRMLKPILAELARRGLTKQIDYLTFSTGYPYAVDFSADFGDQKPPAHLAPIVSLNAAAYFYQQALDADRSWLSLDANDYFVPVIGERTISWAFAGKGAPGAGKPHFLSTILGSTYGRGNTAAEIVAYLQRAKAADGNPPPGTIYYMQNQNVRSQARHNDFPRAIAELRALGVRAELLQGIMPMERADVAGITTGTSHLRLKTSGSRLLSGALVDNLTSAAGQLVIVARVPDQQTPVSEFMRLGAAGASGTVVEPYAIAEKFPSASLHVHYARGCSLAEAFYQSVHGPFQLLIVGDPLCQPWAKFPQVTVEGIEKSGLVSGTVALQPTAAYPDGRHAKEFELYVDGVRQQTIGPDKTFSLDAKELADGWHELRIVTIDDTPIATRGVWRSSVLISNAGNSMQLSVEQSRVSTDGVIATKVEATAPLDAEIMHNGRQVGVIRGGRGRVQIQAAAIGKGRVSLYAQQRSDGKMAVQSRPVELEIQ